MEKIDTSEMTDDVICYYRDNRYILLRHGNEIMLDDIENFTPPGSREDGKYYEGSYVNENGYPVEVIQFQCCKYIKAIPIKNREKYVNSAYKGSCPHCDVRRPLFEYLIMPRDIEYITPILDE